MEKEIHVSEKERADFLDCLNFVFGNHFLNCEKVVENDDGKKIAYVLEDNGSVNPWDWN